MAVLKLTVENGSFAYPKGPQIFADISFEVESGQILAILGPNGAGKTTMLRCVMGMLRWKSGRSLLDGEDIRTMPARRQWSRMAYVPQAKSVTGSYTVFQTVLLGRSSRISGFSTPGKEDMDAASEALDRLGIGHLASKPCSAISGGELQMVLIARALAAKPRLLVLDEPESNLDFRNQLIVLDAMSALAEEGMACVFNTHYPAHALQRANSSLILSKGGNCVYGPTSRVITEENIRNAFGVNAVIGQVETPQSLLKNVMPVSLAETAKSAETARGSEDMTASAFPGRSIAGITILANSNEMADKINAILHEYRHLLIGRMGMPYREAGVYIIYTAVDGAPEDIGELTHRLSLLRGVSVKTAFAAD